MKNLLVWEEQAKKDLALQKEIAMKDTSITEIMSRTPCTDWLRWRSMPKAKSLGGSCLSHSYVDNDGALQVGMGCHMFFHIPLHNKIYFIDVLLPEVFRKLEDLGHEVKAFVGEPVVKSQDRGNGEILMSIPILSMGSLNSIEDLKSRTSQVSREILSKPMPPDQYEHDVAPTT
jgi:hypothetical protein